MSKRRRKPKRRAGKAARGRSGVRKAPKLAARTPDGEWVELVEYEIVSEPMDHPYLRKMTPQEIEDMDWAASRLQTEPERCVEILEPLIEKHPDFPMLYNHLSAAWLQGGRKDEAIELMRETYRRFPKYLFGRISYALECLREGRVDEVPDVFEHRFGLHQLYPERGGRFHHTEFVQFNAVMGLYFARIGQHETAEKYLKMIEELDPEHPLVRMLAAQVGAGGLKRLFQNLLPLRRKRPRGES
jgi:tetratricopeptide (TPR) repeat protein